MKDASWRDLLEGGHERGKFEFCTGDITSAIFEFICALVLASFAVAAGLYTYKLQVVVGSCGASTTMHAQPPRNCAFAGRPGGEIDTSTSIGCHFSLNSNVTGVFVAAQIS